MTASSKSQTPVIAPKLTRTRALQFCAVEGLAFTPRMAETFADFDRESLTGDERRRALLAAFKPKG